MDGSHSLHVVAYFNKTALLYLSLYVTLCSTVIGRADV